jgi:protein involved in temperature-dependent protein secretion
MTPGTYYNVIARLDTTWSADADATAAGAGARLMVVVGGDGKIKEVQITAGGTSKYVAGKKKNILC